ncbi:uncharacterized protein [Haliotis cracherodii]|uniref:uncharacterized protein n=1 Tax=Haliotis cracherodii TaxID=6455 RepID=UPI0039EA88D6
MKHDEHLKKLSAQKETTKKKERDPVVAAVVMVSVADIADQPRKIRFGLLIQLIGLGDLSDTSRRLLGSSCPWLVAELSASSLMVFFIGNDNSVDSAVCHDLQLDAAQANTDMCHITIDVELVSSLPATQHNGRGRLQKYVGACTPTPLPPPPSVNPVYRNTKSSRPGTQATLHCSVVLDVGRGRFGFIDLDREVVSAKVDVERESLLPIFGVGLPVPSQST